MEAKGLHFFIGLLFLLIDSKVNTQQTFADTISKVSYSKNDGTLNFANAWNETLDNDIPVDRIIRITGNEFRFRNIDNDFITRDLYFPLTLVATFTIRVNTSIRNRIRSYLVNNGLT